MTPKGETCHCATCGTTCEGRFKGCAQVWERGPLEIEIVRPPRTTARHRAMAAVSASADAVRPRARRGATLIDLEELDEQVADDLALEPVLAAPVESEPDGGSVSGSDPASLGAAVERLQRELSLLEEALQAARPEGVPARVVTLAQELPRRVGAIIARAIEADEPDRAQIKRIEDLVVLTRDALELRSWRAPDGNGQTARRSSGAIEPSADTPD